jgi:hypothetical protein
MIEPLTLMAARGQRAAADIRDGENLMRRMAAWDLLNAHEKGREYAKGSSSRYADIPGFEPVHCVQCSLDVHPDFTGDPEGLCPVDAGHTLWSHGLSDQAAA